VAISGLAPDLGDDLDDRAARRRRARLLRPELGRVLSRKWIGSKVSDAESLAVNRAELYRRDLDAQKGRMGRTAEIATAGNPLPLPLQFLAAWIGMWLGEHQARVIEYQRAENAALLERLGKRRLRLTDGERRRLAKLGKALGRKALQQVATIATPDTVAGPRVARSALDHFELEASRPTLRGQPRSVRP
jgi:hypothetical protein